MIKKKVVILLGPPGSGKGTQAVRLCKRLQLPHLSTGDLFRENIGRNTKLGQQAKAYMDKGLLVPDAIVLDMLFDRTAKPDCAHGYLLDGFPRTIPQAEALDKHIEQIRIIALNLLVRDELIIKRIEGRLTCSKCGHIHNRYFSPPQVQSKCDKCQGELIQRSDDNVNVVIERLRVYNEQTKPLINYYEKKGVLKNIDGEQDPEIVSEMLIKSL